MVLLLALFYFCLLCLDLVSYFPYKENSSIVSRENSSMISKTWGAHNPLQSGVIMNFDGS